MATPPPRGEKPKPPMKGSFPLDHFGDCEEMAKAYNQCLRENNYLTARCRDAAKLYLNCRMET